MKTTVRFRMQPGDEELAPRKAHPDDAAYDLRASRDLALPAGQVRPTAKAL